MFVTFLFITAPPPMRHQKGSLPQEGRLGPPRERTKLISSRRGAVGTPHETPKIIGFRGRTVHFDFDFEKKGEHKVKDTDDDHVELMMKSKIDLKKQELQDVIVASTGRIH